MIRISWMLALVQPYRSSVCGKTVPCTRKTGKCITRGMTSPTQNANLHKTKRSLEIVVTVFIDANKFEVRDHKDACQIFIVKNREILKAQMEYLLGPLQLEISPSY